MNANELAEIIEHLENARYIGASKAAEMLRQQQAEIEALKQIIDANNLNQNIGQFVKPTNEPVAYVDPIWMDRPDLVMSHQLEIGKLFARTQFTNYVPLYTHPVKELTDEEIMQIVWQQNILLGNADLKKFARTILRKAQEVNNEQVPDFFFMENDLMGKR